MIKQKDIFVLGINGAKQKDCRCGTLLSKAIEESKKHEAETEIAHLIDYKNHMKRLHAKIRKANSIIFSTPVYWYTMSALMKELIDTFWNLDSPKYPLENKVAGFIATCEEDGGMKTVLDMAGALNGMGMLIPPFATFYHNINMAGMSEEQWQLNDHILLGKNMVKYEQLASELTKKHG